MNWLRIVFVRPLATVASLWRVRLTWAGKLVVAGCLLAVLSTVGIQIPTDQLATALGGMLVISIAAGLIFYPRLRIQGDFPAKATAGHHVSGQFTITNRSRFPVFDIELGMVSLPLYIQRLGTSQSIPVLGGGESIRVTVTLMLQKRGLFQLPDVLATSTFPFNLFRLGRCRQRLGSLLVLPSFQPLTSLDLPLGRRYQPGGVALSSLVGESPEYIGSRNYLPGESMRRIDHRAWARLGVPAVREFQEEYYCRVGIVMDTFVPRRIRGSDRFPLQAIVSLTAAVTEILSRGESLVNLFASGPELYVFESGRHTAHLEYVLEILACVELCRKRPYEALAPAIAEQLGQIAATVCILLDWDEPRRQMARTVIESGSHLKLIFVREGETSLPFDESEFADVRFVKPADVMAGKVDGI